MEKGKNWSDPEDLEHSLSKGNVYPLYYLYGNDHYLLERGVRQIKTKIFPSSQESAIDTYSASETPPSVILNDARTLPFFTPSRIILVKEAHLFKPDHWKEFFPYLENPVFSTILIFVSDRLDLGKEVYRLIKGNGIVVKFDHPFKTQLAQWIKRIAQEFGKEITSEAVTLLSEVVGNDLLRIRSELEKVSLYGQGEKIIDAEAIKEVVAEAKMETIFSLVDCIGRKERDIALEMVWRLIESGQPPLIILSLISRQIRLIARGKEMLQEGMNPYDLAKNLRIKEFKLKDFQDQLSRFSPEEIKGIFTKLALTDFALKSSRLNKGMILERLILEMCS